MVPRDLKKGQKVGHIRDGVVRKGTFEGEDPNGNYIFKIQTKLGPFTITLTVALDEQAVLHEIEPIACCR